jgi:hypothetical protein
VPTCVYCRVADPRCGFTREHVLPSAFGAFQHALTLTDTVCAECNQYFGQRLDRLLARDSGEAVLRLRFGLKDPAGLPEMFADRVRVRLPDDGSRWGGVILRFASPAAGNEAPGVDIVAPQVGFERNDGRWDYFTEEELPPSEELAKRMQYTYTGSALFFTAADGDEHRLARLLDETAGGRFKVTGRLASFPPFERRNLRAEVNWRFDTQLSRGVAKIALNYLAKLQGSDFAMHSDFDPVRRFVRFGETAPSKLVRLYDPAAFHTARGPAPSHRGHLLAMSWDTANRCVLVAFSPFLETKTYMVMLAEDFRGVWREIGAAHFYDLEDKRAYRLGYTRLHLPS